MKQMQEVSHSEIGKSSHPGTITLSYPGGISLGFHPSEVVKTSRGRHGKQGMLGRQ